MSGGDFGLVPLKGEGGQSDGRTLPFARPESWIARMWVLSRPRQLACVPFASSGAETYHGPF